MLRVYKLDMGTFSSYQPHHPCSSTSRLRASMSIPDQTYFEDHDTVRLFCSNALKISAEKGYLPEGKQLHARLIKFGFCHVLSLQNQILSVYLKCKETEDVEKLFDGLPVRNVVSWNIMIRGIVESCDNENELDLKVGFDLDCFVGCALVDLYAKCGFVENARRVFCVAPFRDLVMWNVMISCYTFNCLPEEAFSSMLSVLSDDALGYYDFGKQIHSLVLRQSFDSDVLVASALINMYSKNKNIIDARRVFDEMSIRNVVAWNTMVVGCGNHGDGNEVMRLLREMLREGFLPDELTISSVISSCGYASAITETLQAHAFAVKLSCHDFLSVANSLISAYSKCGSIASAFKCFELTSQPDLVTWTSLICAYAFHGLAKEATEMFEKMLSRGIIPDKIAFLGVLTACAHRGLVTKGLHISECCHKFISKWPWQKKLVEISEVAYHSHQPARKYKSTQTFASGILVPKGYIWPIDAAGYLQPHTTLVSDAHKAGLEVDASDFANDFVSSSNYSYDPLAEYLQFIDNGDFSVDGVLTDFPITPSEAIDCFARLGTNATRRDKTLIISKFGASGDYPACTNLAYNNAISDGADVLDCPVQISKDGIPFCLSSIDLLDSTTVAQTSFIDLVTSSFLQPKDDPDSEISKVVRAMRKKLQQIEMLETKQSKGHILDDQQMAKPQSKSALESSL
ncbi:hypothetical protein KIW84_051805 [Lathyrus oleraceus]|uniref:glycerophosphodiester phosphodiesterase n=1 Tax=Pisum sativum TaxID=3888 RepID=A0A9D5AGI4_PEA|nr:hypothetical protein KIW84_051805 [Pisum sativum]